MSDRRWFVLSIAAMAVVVLLGVGAVLRTGSGGPSVTASPTPLAVASPSHSSSPSASPSQTASPSPTVSPSPTPTPTPKPIAVPIASGDPRLHYAEFVLRVSDDRTEVNELNESLTDAVKAQDEAAVRAASNDILDFVAAERAWLKGHPPARCYLDAYKAADAMLVAYGKAANAFVAWADATGFDRLTTLAKASDAADAATRALNTFIAAMAATTCAS